MSRTFFLLPLAWLVALLAACSDSQSTKLPADATQLNTIQADVAKLGAEDRRLFEAYVARHKTMSVFSNVSSGSKPATFPPGATIGDAVAEQRKMEAADAAARQAPPAK